MILLVSILSFVLSFAILYSSQKYLTRDRIFIGDTFFHLLVIESIREHNWKYPSAIQNVNLVEIDKKYNYLAYPPLFHFLSALFPKEWDQKIVKYTSVVTLSFLSSVATIVVYDLTSHFVFAMLSSFIVIVNFSALSLVVQFSPRPLGLFFYSLLICIAVFYAENPFSLIAIALLVALISLTHKFAVQVLIFGFLPYIFLFGELYFLLSLVFGFLLSILMSRGFYLKILKEHISWLLFYKRHSLKTRIIANLTAILSRNFWVLLIVISIMFVLLQNDWNLLENVIGTDLLAKLVFWAFINILLSVLISIPALSCMGEYYRYVEYSIVPVGIVASLFVLNLSPYILLISLVCVSVSLLALLKFRKYLVDSKSTVDPDDILSYRSLRKYGIGNLLVFPGNRTLEVAYYSRISVIHPVRGAETASEQIAILINNYEIRYVLKFKVNDRYQLFETMANMMQMRKILDCKNFELYRITQENGLVTSG